MVILLTSVTAISCSQQSFKEISFFLGIDLPDSYNYMTFNSSFTKTENFQYNVQITYSDFDFLELIENIRSSPLYNLEYDDSMNTRIRDSLCKYNLTGYWQEARGGYLFYEPPLGKYINSYILYNDSYFVEAVVVNEDRTLYYKFEKLSIDDPEQKK
ncbi:MAG: hypothetical protein ACP5FK_06585 [bacterium]